VAGKARPGVYDKLVSRALGKPFAGKVRQTTPWRPANTSLLLRLHMTMSRQVLHAEQERAAPALEAGARS
jgi:ribosomal protein S30